MNRISPFPAAPSLPTPCVSLRSSYFLPALCATVSPFYLLSSELEWARELATRFACLAHLLFGQRIIRLERR